MASLRRTGWQFCHLSYLSLAPNKNSPWLRETAMFQWFVFQPRSSAAGSTLFDLFSREMINPSNSLELFRDFFPPSPNVKRAEFKLTRLGRPIAAFRFRAASSKRLLPGNVLKLLAVLVDDICELGASWEELRQGANYMQVISALGNWIISNDRPGRSVY
jgi:hypothetical protein